MRQNLYHLESYPEYAPKIGAQGEVLTICSTSASLPTMTLSNLVIGLKDSFFDVSIDQKHQDRVIKGLQVNTALVNPGDMFVAVRGSSYDSHQDLNQVIKKNPAAVVVQRGCYKKSELSTFDGPVIEVLSSRQALALLSQSFYGEPSKKLFCIGVTGTNGKTSVTCMVEHLLNSHHIPTARIGTLGNVFKEHQNLALNTTPGPLELAQVLHDFEKLGAKALVMEVSSHALDQHRVDGMHFNSVVFLNLTHDHLDYHGSMPSYFAAKQRLVTDLVYQSKKSPCFVSVNLDDSWGAQLQVNSRASILSFGKTHNADLRYKVTRVTWEGTYFEVLTPSSTSSLFIPLVGEYNVSNFMAAVSCVSGLGISFERAADYMAHFTGVPGRLQRVLECKERLVFIDYAHTPDALSNTLEGVRAIHSQVQSGSALGKIWLVFGCGGDRDTSKRPIMAQVAQKLADQIVITSDNPRFENAESILDEIALGFRPHSPNVYRRVDRSEAIAFAMSSMAEHDILIIAGKGHESYQDIKGHKYPFSDYQEVLKVRGV